MKHEWKKDEKHIYLPKQTPEIITLPRYKYFTITGTGNPNGADFTERIGALYPLAYAVKMKNKHLLDYTVYPLEGVWDLTEKGRVSETLDKNELVYKIMLRQPEFVSSEIFDTALKSTLAKKDVNPLVKEVVFEEIEDGLCVQMLHTGSYDSEAVSLRV